MSKYVVVLAPTLHIRFSGGGGLPVDDGAEVLVPDGGLLVDDGVVLLDPSSAMMAGNAARVARTRNNSGAHDRSRKFQIYEVLSFNKMQ